jgi:methylated-DNA-[protein]-cysteine S-methyltransferase
MTAERTTHHYHVFETAGGFCGIVWNAKGVVRFQLPAPTAHATAENLLRRAPGTPPGSPTESIAATEVAATRYFDGEHIDFSTVIIDLSGQGEFFKQIYAAARRIAWGKTTTYGALAKEIGAGPETSRAVGQAMASNPVPLIIPCHRVLAAGGKVGGFSAPGGAASKIRMLELEGVNLKPAPPAQHSLEW